MFKAYLSTDFNFTHEREMFYTVFENLKSYYEQKDNEFVYLTGNFSCPNQLDALLLKRDAIIVIEFKDYSGHIIACQNAKWTVETKENKVETNNNPFVQVQENKFSLLKYLEKNKYFEKVANLGHISGVVVFRKCDSIDDSKIDDKKIKKWFHITDLERFTLKVAHICSKCIRLTQKHITDFIEKEKLKEYIPPELSAQKQDSIPEISSAASLTSSEQKQTHSKEQSALAEKLNRIYNNEHQEATSENIFRQIPRKTLEKFLSCLDNNPELKERIKEFIQDNEGTRRCDLQLMIETSFYEKIEMDKKCDISRHNFFRFVYAEWKYRIRGKGAITFLYSENK